MHRNLFVTTAFLICVWSQPCCAGTTNTVVIGRAWEKIVGLGYENRYSVPTKAEALAKLKSFRDLGREVTQTGEEGFEGGANKNRQNDVVAGALTKWETDTLKQVGRPWWPTFA